MIVLSSCFPVVLSDPKDFASGSAGFEARLSRARNGGTAREIRRAGLWAPGR